jgi:hypothetical protein
MPEIVSATKMPSKTQKSTPFLTELLNSDIEGGANSSRRKPNFKLDLDPSTTKARFLSPLVSAPNRSPTQDLTLTKRFKLE